MKPQKISLKLKNGGRNDAVINAEIGHCYKAKDEYEEALKYYLQAEKLIKRSAYNVRNSLALWSFRRT